MSTKRVVSIVDGKSRLTGELTLPDSFYGLVVFAHGSGSSRFSPRNQRVAEVLNSAGLATLLLDLLTPDEDRIYGNRFNIDLLSHRLERATKWMTEQREFEHLPLGFFGASTGAAAALKAATHFGVELRAVVSRGGRPDLAGESLPKVQAATLLIVGGDDVDVIRLNREAFAQMHCERELQGVPDAGHLFEEPGKLQLVADLAAGWFLKHFVQVGSKIVSQVDRPEEQPPDRSSEEMPLLKEP